MIENDKNQDKYILSMRASLPHDGVLHHPSVLHWNRPGLTLDRGGVYKAESLPLVGDQIQGGAL